MSLVLCLKFGDNSRSAHGIVNPANIAANCRPLALPQNDHCDPTTREVLLIAKILIGSYEYCKLFTLRRGKEIPVAQTFPPDSDCFDDLVPR